MSKYKIEVVHDELGEVVKVLEFKNKRQLEKGYNGLLRQLNMSEYTANPIGLDE